MEFRVSEEESNGQSLTVEAKQKLIDQIRMFHTDMFHKIVFIFSRLYILGCSKVILETTYMEHLMQGPHHQMLNGVMNAVLCITNVVLCMFAGAALPSIIFQGFLIVLFASLTIRNVLKYIIAEIKIIQNRGGFKFLNDIEMKLALHLVADYEVD